MKVFIASAANREIDEKYLKLASDVSEIFSKNIKEKFMHTLYLNGNAILKKYQKQNA